jgi:hypothetical protein
VVHLVHAASDAPTIASQQAAIARAVRRRDHFRRSPFAIGGRGGHKEWHHFCVQGPDVDLLVNFSASDDVRPAARAGAELPRVTCLVRDGRTWDGDVEAFGPEDASIAPGDIDIAMGQNRLRFVDGRYHLDVAMTDRPLRAHVELEPRVLPAMAPNIPLPNGPPLHWVIVPRLAVTSGWVSVAGRRRELTGGMAYHDHNWGHFLWGHAFAWTWGFALPADPAVPWSVAFVRLTNRLRTRALAQGLFLWRNAGMPRVFREDDLHVRASLDPLRADRVLKIPRVMGLVSPDAAADVPRWVEFRAAVGRDVVELRFEAADVVQVVIPSETDASVTIINEVAGSAEVRGRVDGASIAFGGRAVCEFLGS